MTPLVLLRDAYFARALPDRVLERLAALARVVEWNEGTLIFREGDIHSDFYIVCSGHVVLEMNVPARRPTRILTVRSGEPLGWSAFLADGRMTTNAASICGPPSPRCRRLSSAPTRCDWNRRSPP